MNVRIYFKNYPPLPYTDVKELGQIRIVTTNNPKQESYYKNEDCLKFVPLVNEVYTFKGEEKILTVFGSEIFCVEFTNV